MAGFPRARIVWQSLLNHLVDFRVFGAVAQKYSPNEASTTAIFKEKTDRRHKQQGCMDNKIGLNSPLDIVGLSSIMAGQRNLETGSTKELDGGTLSSLLCNKDKVGDTNKIHSLKPT